MEKVVIVSAARTPLGSFGGTLSRTGATDLGAHIIKEVIHRSEIDPKEVDECIMGMVLPCGYGQNPAKQALIKADLPQSIEGMTINKVCGSSLKSIMVAAQAIGCGDADVIVAGGMENMTMAPYYLSKARWGHRMGDGKLKDHMLNDGLWDTVNDFHMGISNELVCEKWNVSREEQDQFALESYEKANSATQKGYFEREIAPIPIATRKGDSTLFKDDECLVETTMETLSNMKSAFKKGGVGTAGNSSTISDGAAAVLLMSEKKAKELGCTVMAEVGAQAGACIELKHILMAPIHAVPKVLKKEGLKITDIDLWELNEAFSGSSVAVRRVLEIDPEIINVNGGSVALGHPIGASGARILTTLLYEMERRDVNKGLASLCLGGGEAVALVVKRV